MDEPSRAALPSLITPILQLLPPKTLAGEIHARGRLPVEECITLGITLNLALGHCTTTGSFTGT